MSEQDKDKLIEAQKQVIGILFEIVKRQQTNNDLDSEYFELTLSASSASSSTSVEKTQKDQARLAKITSQRQENAKIIGRLLEQLQIND